MMEEGGRRGGAVETGSRGGRGAGVQQDVWGNGKARRGERIDGGKEKRAK